VLPVGENEEQWNYGPERYPLVSQIILISTPARLYLLDQVADSTLVVNKLRSFQKRGGRGLFDQTVGSKRSINFNV
jgi:hypothetical protein